MPVPRPLSRRVTAPGVGDRLRTAMRYHPAIRTPEQLALASGISRTTINVALKTDAISANTASALARAIGLSELELLGKSIDEHSSTGETLRPVFLPQPVLLQENEIERSLIAAGATEHELDLFRRWVRESEVITTHFGKPRQDKRMSRRAVELYERVAGGYKQVIEQIIRERDGVSSL